VHDGGDHAILVGQVIRASLRDGEPLLFWGGRYGDFLHHS
jgi:flavin reductase (DIM6/NTAB) family NADH-FMN oxidoreductase RutF